MISYRPVQQVAGLSPHGILAGVGFLCGLQLFLREVRRRGDIPEETVIGAFTWALAGGVVGARLAFVATHAGLFFGGGRSVAETARGLVDVRHGGLALFGALVGGAIPPTIVGLRIRAHLPRGFDAAAPGIALGIAVGRIGDLVVWDHLGKTAPSWLRPVGYTVRAGYHLAPGFAPSPAVALPPGETCARAVKVPLFYAGCTYHEPALYDLAGAALLFAVLMLMRHRAKARAGTAIFVFAAWYGTQRLLIDTTRAAEVRRALGLTGTQVFGTVLALAGVSCLVAIRLRRKGFGESAGDPPSRLAPMVKPPRAVAATPAPEVARAR